MASKNTELYKYFNEATNKLTKLGRKVTKELQDKLDDADPEDVSRIVNRVWKEYAVPAEYQDILLSAAQKSAELSVDIASPVSFRTFYMNSLTADGEKLSTKIYGAMSTTDIISDIRQSMTVADKWGTLASDLAERGVVRGSLPGYVDDLLQKGRQAAALTGDTDAYAVYRRALSRVKERISGLKEEETSELAQAYRDIAALSTTASDEVVDKTIERAIMYKARANANRLALTEAARAYGMGRLYEIQNDEDAVGVQVTLSEAHEGYCVCDFFADSDMFDMGAGIYPVDQLPEFPFHPYCQCMLDPVYKGATGEYDDAAGEKEFNDLEDDEQAALVGKDGEWDDLDWSDQKIPKGFEDQVEK